MEDLKTTAEEAAGCHEGEERDDSRLAATLNVFETLKNSPPKHKYNNNKQQLIEFSEL